MHIAAAMGTPTVALFGPSRRTRVGPVAGAARGSSRAARTPAGPAASTAAAAASVSECLADAAGGCACCAALDELLAERAVTTRLAPRAPDRAQRYNPYGGAERFVERALAALAGAGVALTLITPRVAGRAGSIAIAACNPFHVGQPVARLELRPLRARARSRANASTWCRRHERIPGCDIYRAGDGVHATWLERRGAHPGPAATARHRALNPWHRYTLAAERAHVRATPRLKAVICNSRMVRDDIAGALRRAGRQAACHLQRRRRARPSIRALRRAASARACARELGVADDDAGVPVRRLGIRAQGRRRCWSMRSRACTAAWRNCWSSAADQASSATAAAGAAPRGGRSACASSARSRMCVRSTAPPTLFVLPTLYDPLPNAALEALACGLPVLTSTQQRRARN
ncbi:MAG: glycosyltransferase [Comamonadaceae bacterium]|nr:glycosyltransferase [Comamonadaceae bacterium]